MYTSSSEISGLIGGQMAMFGNQSAMAYQISGSAGVSPRSSMMAGGGMQNPYPAAQPGELGNRIAGGIAMAAPGAMTGLAVAGGLHGMFSKTGTSPLDIFDPFTQGARGFAKGIGASGMGFGGTMDVLGGAFRAGGLRAGMGALGGGLAGAAIGAAPVMAAGFAVQQAAGAMYRGVQEVSDVGNMANQYFGPQFGTPGARTGGEMGRGSIKQITEVLGSLFNQDIMGSMKELKNLMDKSGQLGLLTGITDAQSFKQQFGKIVGQVRDLAKIMGTTLEEAAPAYFQMRQMGLWKTSDIVGTAISAKAVGPQAAPQLMQTMAMGSQISHAMGGTRRAGATLGRESFMNIQAAQRAGVFSAEDVEEFTGGLTGAEGQAAVAQRMSQIASNLVNTSAGRAMMVGLGATRAGEKGREYTGDIDKGRLNQFLSGGLGVEGLLSQGRETGSTRSGAMTFTRVQERLGQNLAAEGGMEAIVGIVQKIADSKFKGDENARHHLFKQMLGVSNREAELLGEMANNLPRIMDEKSRQVKSAIDRSFDEYNRKTYRSIEGVKNAFSRSVDMSMRPLEEMGGRMATSIGEAVDEVSDTIMGRTRRIAMGTEEKARLVRQGSMTADFSKLLPTGVGQSFVTGGTVENFVRRLGSGENTASWMYGGAAAGALGGAKAGAAIGTAIAPGIGTLVGGALGTLAGGAIGLGVGGGVMGSSLGEGMTPKARALRRLGIGTAGGGGPISMGGGYTTSNEEVQLGIRKAYERAMGADNSTMGVADAEVSRTKSALEHTVGRHFGALKRIKDRSPRDYEKELMRLMEQDNPGVFRGMSEQKKLDLLSGAQRDSGYSGSDIAIDFKGALSESNYPTTPEEISKFQNDALSEIRSELERGEFGSSDIFAAEAGVALDTDPQGDKTSAKFAREDIEKALTGAGSDIFSEYVSGDKTGAEAIQELLRSPGGSATAGVIDRMEALSPKRKEKILAGVRKFAGGRGAQAQLELLGDVRAVAEAGPSTIKGRGIQEKTSKGFESLVSAYKGGKTRDEIMAAVDMSRRLGQSLTEDEASALAAQGGGIGMQAAAFHKIGAMSGSLDEGRLAGLQKEFLRLGYDVEKAGGQDFKNMAEEGISGSEMVKFKDILDKMVSGSLTKTDGGMSVETQAKKQYIEAHIRFIETVGRVLKDEDLGGAAKKLKEESQKTLAEGKVP